MKYFLFAVLVLFSCGCVTRSLPDEFENLLSLCDRLDLYGAAKCKERIMNFHIDNQMEILKDSLSHDCP